MSSFYNQAALVAASMGVMIDLFGVSTEPLGLEILGALAHYTGGGIWNYASISDAMMAQVVLLFYTLLMTSLRHILDCSSS